MSATEGIAPRADHLTGGTGRAGTAPPVRWRCRQARGNCVVTTDDVLRRAPIGLGDIFVTEGRARDLRSAFPTAAAVDMESAGIARFAHAHDMPFVSVRGISDLCAPDRDEFKEHLADAAAGAARVVYGVVPGLVRDASAGGVPPTAA